MYLEELQVGAEYPIESVTIEKEKMLDFARLYDPIPLHLDEEYAKNETVRIGFRQGKIPNEVRVAAALISVAERAKTESPFFSMPKMAESEDK